MLIFAIAGMGTVLYGTLYCVHCFKIKNWSAFAANTALVLICAVVLVLCFISF